MKKSLPTFIYATLATVATVYITGCTSHPAISHSTISHDKQPAFSLSQQADRSNQQIQQGTLLPYTVLNAELINHAYPQTKLQIRNGGFGSDAAAHPSQVNQFYAITDRGPNANHTGEAGKGKQFLTPTYTPRIGLFEQKADGSIKKVKEILLKDKQGNPISGLPNPKAVGGTNEIAYDAYGNVITVNSNLAYDETSNPIKTDIYGLDAEGLAALKDGSFWVSDEYGPHIVHYNAQGVEIQRINPFEKDNRSNMQVGGKRLLLPAEFAKRRANRGMEGLTITPDQTTLVGIMQSSMDNPDKSGRKTDLTRIVSINLRTGKVSQYLYAQQKAENSNSGIVAINNHEFYVIERDGKFALQDDKAQKHVYKIDLSEATDLEKLGEQQGITQDAMLGIMIDGKTLEQIAATQQGHWQLLAEHGIKPVAKSLVVDAVQSLGYPHDKLEGLWLRADGSIGLLNDDDFAVWTDEGKLEQKYLDNDKSIEDGNRLYIVKPTL